MGSFSENGNSQAPTQLTDHEKTFTEHCQEENHLSSQANLSLCTQDKLQLSAWGLPEGVLGFYESKGIIHMFRWQLECLTRGRVLDGGNLVYSAPTSAGKTLVAEILIAKTLFEIQKKVLVILPFVSVVREKMFYFQGMYSSSGIQIEGYMGGHSPSISFKQAHLAVCTIEKANSIINRLLEEQNLQSLGLVVVDELHLLGDPYRGYLLELLLTKLKFISMKSDFNIQIVGMSATLPNLKSLADWLNANLYYTDFRPVPLVEKLKCGNIFFDKKLNKLHEITILPSESSDDSENVGQLCLETISNGHSVLIFCPTKVWCESLAEKIALFFRKNGCSKSAEVEGTPGWILRKQLNLQKINEVIEHLKMCPVGLDKDLHKSVAYGVAFHHAGLTLDERDIIEGSFRQGSIRVLCATSTLSSGVNLPARRVIIRSPMSFGGLMDILTYRQMIGRAGRMGVDSEGESILISKPNEKTLCQNLMCSTLKPIESCLGHGRLSASLKRALLEIIASGVASSPEEVKKYASCTFLAFSSRHDIEDPMKSCIEFLEENEFIRLQENGSIFAPTPLGKACLASSLPPDEGLALFRELQRARRCFVLDTDLHIIYQVTPYSVSEQWSKVDWLNVLNILECLPPSMKRVGEMVGIEESFLVRVAKGMINTTDPDCRNKLAIHRRFYTSLALQDLIHEIPLSVVAEKYECNKGLLQSLQQSAATYAGMVTEFTKCLGWSSIELIFSQFQERLQFGIQRELCELMRLPLLNAMRARVLFNAGFTSLSAIANASLPDLENAFFTMAPFQSKKEIAGETSYDKEQRNKSETIWVTGRADLTISDAAELLLKEARNILELELGLEGAKWGKNNSTLSDSTYKSPNKSTISLNSKRNFLKETDCEGKESSYVAPENASPQKVVENTNAPSRNFSLEHPSERKQDDTSLFKKPVCDMNYSNEHINVPESIENSGKSIQRLDTTQGSKSSIKKEVLMNRSKEKVVVENYSSSPFVNKEVNRLSAKEVNSYENNLKSEEPLNCESKEEFNFTSSYIFDMIPDYIIENQNHVLEENKLKCDGPQPTDAETTSPRDSESVHSPDGVPKNKILDDSKSLNISKLSEDMFEKDSNSSKIMSTPLQVQSCKRIGDLESTNNRLAEVSSPDLFSQSLTFDTQLGRILDFGELLPQNVQPLRGSSFNSDDLGFVSDLSPPLKGTQKKLNAAKELSKIPKESESDKSAEIPGSSFVEKSVISCIAPKDEGRERAEAVKRKADRLDSPDLIVDSDESSTDIHPTTKRPKRSLGEHRNSSNLTSTPLVVNDSDDEIMPTPKLDKSYLSCTGNRSLRSEALRSLNRSMMRRGSQRSKLFSQNLGNSRKNNSQSKKKKKNETLKCRLAAINASATAGWGCRAKKFNSDNINIIDVCESEQVFQSFCEKLKEQNVIGLALGCRRKIDEKKVLIGSRIMKRKKVEDERKGIFNFQYNGIVLDGIAFYWEGNNVCYMSLDDRVSSSIDKINLLSHCSNKTLRVFDTREQVKMLQRCCSIFLGCPFQDPKVGHWLLSETWKDNNFPELVGEYISSSKSLISEIGTVVGFSSPGLLFKSNVSPKTRACLDAYLTFHAIENQLPLLLNKGLYTAFVQIEMPVLLCLAEMELSGFQVCKEKLLAIKDKLNAVKENLEEKAYSLAGHKFSLSSSIAISKVLFKELHLEGTITLTKKRKLLCTNKQALQDLANETKHPLPEIILQWRKIRSISSKFVSSLIQVSLESARIFGVSQTYTVTGRISMHEPNLQNIPKEFIVDDGNKEPMSINLREVFVASKNCVLLSADYCQIELRMLAHLSGDPDLIRNICESSDIFINIAANIFGIPNHEIIVGVNALKSYSGYLIESIIVYKKVDENLRQKAKQTCYGMIYGIGPKTLSQQLKIEEADASILLENFKNKYIEVRNYLEKTINECRKTGYVVTLMGRRRYLSAISDSNPVIRTEAERQAINTTIQGSAADFIKKAMIIWREKINEIILNGIRVNAVLHLHDELIFEVQAEAVEIVAGILKETMESVMELKVPIPVKIKIGPSWGQLKNVEI